MVDVEKIRNQFHGLDLGILDKHGHMIKVGDRVRDKKGEGTVTYLAEHAQFVVLADEPYAYHPFESGDLKLRDTEIVRNCKDCEFSKEDRYCTHDVTSKLDPEEAMWCPYYKEKEALPHD